MTTIVVTGATGNVGSALLTLLNPRDGITRALGDDAIRALVRQMPAQPLPGIDYRIGDFADTASLDHALAGADALFLACPNSPRQVEFEGWVLDRAVRHGIARVVKLSAFGAADDAPVLFWRWHAEIESQLTHSGLSHTILRPYFFMSNLIPNIPPAAAMGMVFAPAENAQIAMIDPRDIAAAAARMLTVTGEVPSVVTLAGPQALTFQEVAEDLSRVMGRSVSYQDVSESAAREQMLAAGMPPFAADQILAVFACLRTGMQARPNGDALQRITGRPPRTLADYLNDVPDTEAAASAALLDTAGVGDVRS